MNNPQTTDLLTSNPRMIPPLRQTLPSTCHEPGILKVRVSLCCLGLHLKQCYCVFDLRQYLLIQSFVCFRSFYIDVLRHCLYCEYSRTIIYSTLPPWKIATLNIVATFQTIGNFCWNHQTKILQPTYIAQWKCG